MKISGFIKSKARKMYDTGALHITLGTFLTKFVAFFGSIVVVRILSKFDYGILGYVENIYSYAFILAGMGLSNGVLRYLVKAEDQKEKRKYYNYIIKNSIYIDLGIALLLCIIAMVVPFPDNYSDSKHLLPILALLLPFQDLLNEELYTIRSFFKNKLYAYMAFCSSALLIGGRVIGARCGGVNGVLWSRTLINATFAIILFVIVSRLFTDNNRDCINKDEKKEVNTYSFQYMITNGFWAIFMLNDTFLLGMLLNDPSALADYKVAYVLPGNLSIFATAIGVYVAPYFIKNEKNLEWIRLKFKNVLILSCLLVGAAASIIAVFANPIITTIYGVQYTNTIALMRVLLLAAFLNSGIRYTIANILAAMGEIKYNMIISGIGIGLQIILDIILIPKIGVMAVAISNCGVYLLMSLALFVVFYIKYYTTTKSSMI